jgi:membrane-bound lytic murein transglycosylase MltF
MNRKVKVSGILISLSFFGYLGLLLHPNFLFANYHNYKNFDVYSDQKIPIDIDNVIEDALVRIKKSELYESDDRFSVFFCNTSWRLSLLTRNPNVGGLVNQGLSNNVFIRESEIEKNKIISPTKGQEIALVEERPLSYFLAHEITHTLQTKIERFMFLTTPEYIVEGYADYIGKGASFDYGRYLNDFKNNHFTMNPTTGLYNKYHLMVAYLIDIKGLSFQEIVEQKRSAEEIENEIKNENTIE